VELGLVENVEDYEGEEIPNAEKMTYNQVVQFFQNKEKIEKNIFQKVMDKVREQFGGNSQYPNIPISQSQINTEEEMTIEAIRQAVQSGAINAADLKALVEEKPVQETPVTNSDPVAVTEKVGITAEQVSKMITDAVQAVKNENEGLKGEIEALKKTPGASPVQIAIPTDPKAGGARDNELMQAAMADAKAADDWKNPFKGV
jgi:hypothetical protein